MFHLYFILIYCSIKDTVNKQDEMAGSKKRGKISLEELQMSENSMVANREGLFCLMFPTKENLKKHKVITYSNVEYVHVENLFETLVSQKFTS